MDTLLNIKNLTKHFDGITALDDFSCSVKPKEILGLIGPNGAGKTTLFNVLTGFTPVENGQAFYKERNILKKNAYQIAQQGIVRTFQDLRLIRQMTVLDNILLAFMNQKGENLRNVFFNRNEYLRIENDNRKQALELLKYTDLVDKTNDLADNLSYGQQKLLSLMCCLAADADLILLDEPVAGINPEMIHRVLDIIRELPKQGKSVILIEHNMDAILNICDRVIFMDAGKIISEGSPDAVRNDPKVIEAYLD